MTTTCQNVSTKATGPQISKSEDISPGVNPDEYKSLMNEFMNKDINHLNVHDSFSNKSE